MNYDVFTDQERRILVRVLAGLTHHIADALDFCNDFPPYPPDASDVRGLAVEGTERRRLLFDKVEEIISACMVAAHAEEGTAILEAWAPMVSTFAQLGQDVAEEAAPTMRTIDDLTRLVVAMCQALGEDPRHLGLAYVETAEGWWVEMQMDYPYDWPRGSGRLWWNRNRFPDAPTAFQAGIRQARAANAYLH